MRKTMSSAARLLLFVVVLLSASLTNAQTLSPGARISLLTAGPGEELYSVFGHTAIRVYDPALNLDRTYGWGGFRFTEDNFYVKFLRGTLPYYIDAYDMYLFMYAYQQENRSVREQVLNLSASQRQRVFQVLETNMLPENRTYQYKFFYDNCATRPRDKLVEACGDSLLIPSATVMTGKSYRDWMNDYLGEKPWAKLGMNLAIGRPADEQTDGWHAMYLPNNVHDQLARATIRQPNGVTQPFVAEDKTLSQAATTFRQQVPIIFDPTVVFAVLGLVIVFATVRQYQRGYVSRRLDLWLFGVVGFLGWFLLLLWVGTDHGVTTWNPTLLYLAPYHLPLIFWATNKNATNARRSRYFAFTGLLIIVGMFLSTVPGGVDVLFPMTLLVRCLANLRPVGQSRAVITA
ncbi:Lnb N-terminal periplasmic domain-containing protein [Spirosoma rhododendri]|uniref:DUF4105 domain-containing protein n=1 Tax=Spirosoma rhododendri TaxID=2728024 RepID=A0A7L5DNY6_9BACT|nr:DUF4105 domain-containing protein [Spirosoma rhododendri]QJD80204.1 DUF4105 domain-containing protein [Spirosoma rhododendri]